LFSLQLCFDAFVPGEPIKESVTKVHSAAAVCHAHLSSFSFERFAEVYRCRGEGKANGARILDVTALLHDFKGVPEGDVEVERSELRPQLAALVVLPLIERALYDLHGSELDAGVAQSSLLLRDIIASEQIKTLLGEQAVILLKTVFSPQGLNLRNLVWHGFLTAEELPPSHVSLLIMLFLSLPTPVHLTPEDCSKDLGSLLAIPSPEDPDLPRAPDRADLEVLSGLVAASPFALPGHAKSLFQVVP